MSTEPDHTRQGELLLKVIEINKVLDRLSVKLARAIVRSLGEYIEDSERAKARLDTIHTIHEFNEFLNEICQVTLHNDVERLLKTIEQWKARYSIED